MAAPPSVTLDDLSGKYVMERTLSDPTDDVLAFQGISWITRQAIYWATITLYITQTTSADDNQIHIDIDQTITGGFKGTTEKRIADNTVRTHTDHVFGTVHGRSLFVPPADVGNDARDATYLSDEDRAFLVAGWDADVLADGKKLFVNYVESETGWVAWGTWGFETVGEGEARKRRYARRQVVRKPKSGESKHVRLYYDYLGPNEGTEGEVAEKEETKKMGEDYISDI